jgi:predicted metal-dependent HD superfamily phosphohydrolase
MKKKLFYFGAFSPFTLQDAAVVAEASADGYHDVVIAIEQLDKPSLFSITERIKMVQETMQWYDKVHNTHISSSIEIVSYYGLPIYEANEQGADTFIVAVKDKDAKICDTKLRLSRKIGRALLSKPMGYRKVVVKHSKEYIEEAINLLFKSKEYIMLAKFVAPPVHNMMMIYLLQSEYETCCKAARISWGTFVRNVSANAYHNLSHIAYILNKYRLLVKDTKDKDYFFKSQTFKAAVFFHDYVVGDEERSFEASKLPESAKGLFMATKHLGDTPENLNQEEQLIHDLDLAILTDKGLYNNYRLGVRFEHADISDLEYIPKRLEVLEKLKHEIAENTKNFSRREIAQAMQNIESEKACYISKPSK